MKTYHIKTTEGLDYRFPSKENYFSAQDDYKNDGSVYIGDTLVERHHKPTFYTKGEDATYLPSSKVPTSLIPREEAIWKSEVLKENMKRIALKKTRLTFWHYKVAQGIANTWRIEDTLSVLESDFEAVDEETKPLIAASLYRDEPTPHNGCGKCVSGWRLDHHSKTARPCGCKDAVNQAYQQAILTQKSFN